MHIIFKDARRFSSQFFRKAESYSFAVAVLFEIAIPAYQTHLMAAIQSLGATVMTFGGQHGSFMHATSRPVKAKVSEERRKKTAPDKRPKDATKVTPKL